MKNKILAVILMITILFTSGCGNNNYITDKEKEPIKYEVTGQYLQKNILCKPKDQELYNLYKKYDKQMNVSIDKLPTCDDYKITSNDSTGLWEFLFVKPLAWLLLETGEFFCNYGIAVIIIGLLIRLILLPFSYKSQKQSANMSNAQADLQRLERKYQNKTDQNSMMMKSQEMMAIYKKHNIKPMGGCLIAFIQLPIFFAFWQALNRIPAIFEGKLFGFNLGMTPAHGLSTGNYAYFILLVLIGLSTYFSFKYTMKTTPVQSEEMQKQTNLMLNIMTVMIIFTSLSLSTALSFYWITTYAFISIQTFIFRKIFNKNNKNSNKNIQKRKSNDKIKEKLKVKEGMKYGKNN